MRKLLNILRDTSNIVIDFCYPRVCLVCGERIEKLDYRFICQKCIDNIPYAPKNKDLYLTMAESFGQDGAFFDSLSSMIDLKRDDRYINPIYELKYASLPQVGREFGRLLGEILIKDENTDYQYIQPVPLHPTKRRSRTYNQSDYIAKGISDVTGIPVGNFARRTVNTVTQTKLSHSDRAKNVKDIFKIKYRYCPKKVLLIDDVLTTGATVNNLAKVFKNSGSTYIGVASIIKA